MEIALWSESNQDEAVAQGNVGELGVRGPSLMLGYFGDQASTERSFNRHGWFMTGDLARLDQSGNLQIVGRKKDLIIRGGHNIYPARIEDFAMRCSLVAKAAAFPVSDERLGERVCLAVIPRPNETIAAGGIAGASQREWPVQIRHARIFHHGRKLPLDRKRKGAQAPAGRDGRPGGAQARTGALAGLRGWSFLRHGLRCLIASATPRN